ncbi:hypothetical protein GF389_02070, partial [Candidatus Dojkabacteria bacterium]|nr:hypothetical protein [Candidatus Dojkabacteria bacterium]
MLRKKWTIVLGVYTITFLFTLSGLAGGIYLLSRESDDDTPYIPNSTTSGSIEAFSEEEFDKYAEDLIQSQENQDKNSVIDGFGDVLLSEENDSAGLGAPLESEAVGDGGDESITNNQESGVDEGDIVKAYGDYFIILRRGKLFSVDVENMEAISQVNTYPEGFEADGWYDEILVNDDMIILIGYNYTERATEIGLFDINDSGKISHQNTYFVDSNDYYSSRNYASRLVDGELILYMPYYVAFDRNNYEPTFPKLHQWDKSKKVVVEGTAILDKTNVYKPVQETLYPTLHTVMRCDVQNFDCEAKGILGPYSRSFYVSSEAIYLWVSDSRDYFLMENSNSDDNQYDKKMN